MRADGEARQPVVGEHPLPGRLLGQLRRRGGWVERERQLARLPARAGNARGTKGEAELPEQPPPLPEFVAGARSDERFEPVAVELDPLRQLADALEWPAPLALLDHGFRPRPAERLHVIEPDPHRVVLERALRGAAVDVDRPHLHPTPLRVPHQRGRRIEAHRLRVQKRREELARVVMAQPRRLVGEQAERRRVGLGEAEAREAGQLVVDPVRKLRVDGFLSRTRNKTGAIGLDRLLAPLAAHRAPQALGLADREARQRHRDLQHLVLEDDHPQRVGERLREQRVVDRRHEARVLSQPLAMLDVRVDGLALDRPGPDECDLDGQVVEVLGPCAQQALHLRAALDLEDTDGVGTLDVVVDVRIVERDAREVEGLSLARGTVPETGPD